MYFARFTAILLLLCMCAGCGDNLFPSGTDKRPPVQPGTTGPAAGQKAPDFSVPDTSGATVTLSSALAGKKGIVLYFTMWCSICDAHTTSMLNNVLPANPTVGFYLVDYVSGSVVGALSAATADGFAGNGFTVLADLGQVVLGSYQGTMGTTVVIDSNGIIKMNEDYQDGSRLVATLAALP
jgi:hypothetical protein